MNRSTPGSLTALGNSTRGTEAAVPGILRSPGTLPLAAFALMLGLPVLVLAGCGGVSSFCDPGEVQYCPCPSGDDGVQTCLDDEEGWDECECGALGDDDDDGAPGDDDDQAADDDTGDDDDLADDDDTDGGQDDSAEDHDEKIIDDLDWSEVADLEADSERRALARFVGYFSFSDADGDSYRCTASLVSPTLIITNHHCVDDGASAFRVNFDYLVDEDYDTRSDLRDDAWICNDIVVQDEDEDMALLRCAPDDNDGLVLSESLGGYIDLELATVPEPVAGDALYVLHQNCYREDEVADGARCVWVADEEDEDERTKKMSPGIVMSYPAADYTSSGTSYDGSGALAHSADTLGGTSGALVFAEASHRAIGLHHSGGTSSNKARALHDLCAAVPDLADEVSLDIEAYSGADATPDISSISYTIDDDTSGGSDGNGDGVIDAGEDIEFLVGLTNSGADTATNLSAVLVINDAYISVTDDSENWPDIAPGATETCDHDFDFDVDPNTPDGHTVSFTLDITADGYARSLTGSFVVNNAGGGGGSPDIASGTYSVDDDTSGGSDGNDDGVIDAGEDIELLLNLTNSGTGTATNVSAVLVINDAYISVTDDSESYPDIAPGATETCNNDFDFDVDPSTPDGHTVSFTLDITADGYANSLTGSFVVTNHGGGGAPNISSISYAIDDDTSGGSDGNDDGVIDAGEDIELLVDLSNSGTATATNVSAALVINDAYISVSDDSEDWPDIAPGATETCNNDFDFDVDPSTPDGHTVSFTLDITADGYARSLTGSFVVNNAGGGGGSPDIASGTYSIDDDTSGGSDGNDDGVIDAGEDIEFLVHLINSGSSMATNVSAALVINDAYISVSDDSEDWPDIAPGATETCTNDFDFDVDPGTPDGHTVSFTLDITADGYANSLGGTFVVTNNGGGGGNGPDIASGTFDIDDDTSGGSDGNGDGVIDAGEDIEFLVALTNSGTGTATNVSAVLVINDAYISVTDDSESYPDIAPGATETCNNDFDFDVDPITPDGHTVSFTLDITADGYSNSLGGYFVVTNQGGGGSPDIASGTYAIDDDTSGGSDGDGDGRIEPGEDIEMLSSLTNSGSGTATNVEATLVINDPYITVTDDSENWPDIAPGATETCNNDFDFEVAPSTPSGHTVSFTIQVSADGYSNDLHGTLYIY